MWKHQNRVVVLEALPVAARNDRSVGYNAEGLNLICYILKDNHCFYAYSQKVFNTWLKKSTTNYGKHVWEQGG